MTMCWRSRIPSLVEAINSLKFSLELSDPDHPVKAVAVTSAVPEEGKTTLAISLARVVAASGKKVILIMDGDLRRSSVGKKLDLAREAQGALRPGGGRRCRPVGIHSAR